MEDDFKQAVQHQRRVNPKIYEVIKKEVLKLLGARLIYPISDSPWESPVHCVPKKGGFTVVKNEENELIPTQLVMRWRVCIDYLKLNDATHKDHFPLSFMDQMLERLEGNEYYYFLDAFSGYFQIPVDPQDQEKTTFTCPYGKFAYRHMPFGLCNEPGVFQRCMMAIFHDMIKKQWKSLWMTSQSLGILSELASPIWTRCLNARPMTRLLEKDTPFIFSKEFIKAFQSLKKKLTEAPILVSPDWDLPFELMCDASDFAIGALATMDPSGDITARTTSLKRCLTPVSIGPQSTMMPMTWSNLVTLVNVRKISQRDEMPQNAIQVCEILTYEASISWGLTVFTREQAYENSLIYKEKTKRIHDSKIKDRVFNIGDQVPLFISRLNIFSGKLKTRWTGPFTVTQAFPYGIVELSQTDRPNFKVNGHKLKHYFGGDIPPMVVLDLQTFSKDQ
nr:reverse transcriptase domain-containing protein [Tanacetum cinerariifolium]